jgi:hypothetical protein
MRRGLSGEQRGQGRNGERRTRMTGDKKCLHAIQGRTAPVGELELAPDRFARLPSSAGTWGETGRTAEL